MTDTSKAAEAGVNTNVLNPEPPENNADRFLGMATKDGEPLAEKPDAAKDTNGKTPAKPAKKPTAVKEDDETEGEDGDDKGAQKPVRSAQKRIDQLTAQKRAAERRADMTEVENRNIRARLDAMEARLNGSGTSGVDKSGKTATSGNEGTAPDAKDYEYGELDAKYIKDLAKHEAGVAYRAERAKDASDAAKLASEKTAKERAAQVETWSAKAPAELDDFDEVVIQGAKDGSWPLSETLGQLLMESDVGHQIAYALASDPKEAARIAKMSSARQATWFGVEEARLTAEAASSGDETDENKPKPKVTQAPAPTSQKAKGAGSSTPVSSDTNDFAAFERLAMKN